MPRIVFIRPAETDFALKGALLGRSDPDLNETGRLNAKLTSRALDGWAIDFLGVTPLKRAIATAWPIEDDYDVFTHPVAGFQGADMGEWDQMDLSLIHQMDRARYQSWQKDPDFPAPGGESIREVYGRAYSELVNIVNNTGQDKTIVLVLQDVVLRAMCCAVLNLPIEAAQRFHLDPSAFGVFERMYPGGPYRLMAWNRNKHLLNQSIAAMEYEEEFPGV